ncbi:hypothetical protein DL95DRAFT_27186 [Leptodontidium sp. 2 PMI_412]|nr:hypothetical protein DL95DRAFT_27186 [Leptodontidium sp. 2 PMI_412]
MNRWRMDRWMGYPSSCQRHTSRADRAPVLGRKERNGLGYIPFFGGGDIHSSCCFLSFVGGGWWRLIQLWYSFLLLIHSFIL